MRKLLNRLQEGVSGALRRLARQSRPDSFPVRWIPLLQEHQPLYGALSPDDQNRFKELVLTFVKQKKFEGCRGFIITEEVKVIIAAKACIMILRRSGRPFPTVSSVLVYPSEFRVRDGVLFKNPYGDGDQVLLGEAFAKDLVILSWPAVQNITRDDSAGPSVVLHEFAHHLDIEDGVFDGTPPLLNREQYRKWVEVMEREFLALKSGLQTDTPSDISAYGATNEAEFFAVLAEEFFEQPGLLCAQHPELYGLLTQYFRFDPLEPRKMEF